MKNDLERIYDELKSMNQKIDKQGEKISRIQISLATTKVEVKHTKKFHNWIWGAMGGLISSVIIAIAQRMFPVK